MFRCCHARVASLHHYDIIVLEAGCLQTILSGPQKHLQPVGSPGTQPVISCTNIEAQSSNFSKDRRQHSAPSPLLLQRGKERKVQPRLVHGAGLLQEAHVISCSHACRPPPAAAARLAGFSLLLILISIPWTAKGLCLAACCNHRPATCSPRPAYCTATLAGLPGARPPSGLLSLQRVDCSVTQAAKQMRQQLPEASVMLCLVWLLWVTEVGHAA